VGISSLLWKVFGTFDEGRLPACFRYEMQPGSGTTIECGAAVSLYGQSGGGAEVKFTGSTKSRCPIAYPILLPEI
jgi:hypothetical protein